MYYHVIPARSVIPGASASLSLTLPLRRADGSPFAARKGPTRRGGSRLLPTHPALSLNTPFKAQSGRRRKYPLIIRGAISVQNSSRFVQPPPSCYFVGVFLYMAADMAACAAVGGSFACLWPEDWLLLPDSHSHILLAIIVGTMLPVTESQGLVLELRCSESSVARASTDCRG